LPLGGKKTGCTFGHFFAIFRLLARFMADCWKTRVFPSAQEGLEYTGLEKNTQKNSYENFSYLGFFFADIPESKKWMKKMDTSPLWTK